MLHSGSQVSNPRVLQTWIANHLYYRDYHLHEFICTRIHVRLIFITTDRMTLHCKQLTLKVVAKLAKVLAQGARQQSLAPAELTLLCAVTRDLNSTNAVGNRTSREKKKRRVGKEEEQQRRDRIFHRRGLLLQSAIVLYLAPLLSPLLHRLFFMQNSSFH